MGSSPSSAPIAGRNALIGVEKLSNRRSSIPIQGRYSNQRKLEDDYTFVASGDGADRKTKVIGTGMNGPVKLATGKVDGRQYAIKSLNKYGLNEKKLTDLKGEVEIFLSLDHPHIARLEHVYETEEFIHLVMEFMAGGELYDRLSAKKRFAEDVAADALRQMLKAVAYLHSHHVCHRDLKLENFLYEHPDTDHLKLIDFGFAKFRPDRSKMSQACGSIHYVAPEVLQKSYTESADMWSMGVLSHMLLTGSPLFRGDDSQVLKQIRNGTLKFSSRFNTLSADAQDFVTSLLKMDPAERLSANQALDHRFLLNCASSSMSIDATTWRGLQKYGRASHFRRACFSLMAWSLSREDRMELRSKFLELDPDNTGTISLPDFKAALEENFEIGSAEAESLFATLDLDGDKVLSYSEFLAASMYEHVRVHEDILRKTFSRFDTDQSGVITLENLRTVLGDKFGTEDVEKLMKEADADGDGTIDYDEFLEYLQNPDLDTPPDEENSPGGKTPKTPAQERRDKQCEIAGMLIDCMVDEDGLGDVSPLSRKKSKVTH